MALNINGTTGISGVDGSASAPALTGTDSNTGINFASDTVNINTGGSTRYSVDSSGNIQAGGANPVFTGSSLSSFKIAAPDGGSRYFFGEIGNSASAQLSLYDSSDSQKIRISAHSSDATFFNSGNVGIGTTAPDKTFQVDSGSNSANHFIAEFTGTDDSNAASCNFYYFGCGSDDNRTGLYWEHQNVGNVRMWMDDSLNLRQSSSTPTANNSGTAFSYAGGSDYRLKKNVVNYTNAITELNQLKPYKFNYIETDRTIVDKPDVLCSGFYAHEAGAVVPASLIGEKDEVDVDGDPIYQSLKYEKFVPLLTAALQEAVAKIEVLETKVAALEAG